VQIAATRKHVRVQFDVEGTNKEQIETLGHLRQSTLLETVTPLGPVAPE
jgi:hypothetical protein